MKDKQLNLRLSNELYLILQAKAQDSDYTVSEYIRRAISSSTVTQKDKNFGQLLGSINRIDNNINQISYSLNLAKSREDLSQFDFNELIEKLVSIEQYLIEVLNDN